jgi:hypothetical protein
MKKISTVLGALMLLQLGCSKQSYDLEDQSATFGQQVTYNNKVDLVLMVDNSSSMGLYQQRLASSAGNMISTLNRFGMDYRIVVITSDMRSRGSGGRFVGEPKVLFPSTENLTSTLATRIHQGQGGSDLERGLESLMTVLSPSYLNGEGRGFLREDALLAVIALSNEDDYSSGSVQFYADFLESTKPKLKGRIQQWVVNFIGVPDLASSCSTALDGIYKEPGLRWIELAQRSGGLVQPICDTDLGKAVSNISQRIVEMLTDFPINGKPKVETIKVRVDGVVVPRSRENGWDYIPELNVIRFFGNFVPGATSRIFVDYELAEAT